MKEEFCGLCVSSGIALLSGGSIAYGSTNRKKGETKRNKQISLVVGIIGLAFSIYFYLQYKKCSKECE